MLGFLRKGTESGAKILAASRVQHLHLAAILLVMVLFVVVGGYIYQQLFNDERETAQARLREVGELKKMIILQWIREQTSDGRAVSSSPVVVYVLGNISGKVSQHELSRHLRIIRDEYQYKAIVVYDVNGNILMAQGESDAAIHRTEALESVTSGKAGLINFHLDYDGHPELGFMTPVEMNGRTIGAVYTAISPDLELYPYIELWPSDSATAETLLIQKDRDEIQYLNNLRHVKSAVLSFRMPMSDANLGAVRAAHGERGIQMNAVDYRGVPVVSYASDIPGTPWILISKLDESEAYAGLNRIALVGFFISSITLLLFILLLRSWWLKSSHLVLEQTNKQLKQATAELKMSEAKFRGIIDSSPVPYALRDDQGNIGYLNEAFVSTYGYDLADIPTLENWWLKAYPDKEYRQRVVETWKSRIELVQKTGIQFEPIELKIACKDGSIRFAKLGTAILGDDYKGAHVVILYDITEYKRMERDLVELNESQLQHLGMELHDNLGQHLTASAILAQTIGNALKRKKTGDEAQIRQVYMLSKQLQEMTAMVRRLSHGLHSVQLAQDDLLEMIASLAIQTTELSGISCRLERGPVAKLAPEISFNLYRIVQEAVNNSIKHSGATAIIISVRTEVDNLLISIFDNGAGMPEDSTTGSGSGLKIMQHRAGMIGAELNFIHQQGLYVTVRMPL
jgi:PAS domain S-box-containing protein